MADWRWKAVSVMRMLIGVVFVYAGAVKFQGEAAFADQIATFRLVPLVLSNLLAVGLPAFEIVLGAWLVIGWRRRTASFCALLTMSVFLLALASAWTRGIEVECGCFGPETLGLSKKQEMWFSFVRDLLLMGMTATVYHVAWHDESAAHARQVNTL